LAGAIRYGNVSRGSGEFPSEKQQQAGKGEEAMAEKVARVRVKKEKGYLYFVDGRGNVSRAPMARAGKPARGKREVIERTGVRKEDQRRGWPRGRARRRGR